MTHLSIGVLDVLLRAAVEAEGLRASHTYVGYQQGSAQPSSIGWIGAVNLNSPTPFKNSVAVLVFDLAWILTLLRLLIGTSSTYANSNIRTAKWNRQFLGCKP